jgi:hypothetical protein
MWKPPEALSISSEQRQTLETWIAARKTPQRLVLRAEIILKAATGAASDRRATEPCRPRLRLRPRSQKASEIRDDLAYLRSTS